MVRSKGVPIQRVNPYSEDKVCLKTYLVGTHCPASILRKSTSDRHRPVSYPDGPMTARYRFT